MGRPAWGRVVKAGPLPRVAVERDDLHGLLLAPMRCQHNGRLLRRGQHQMLRTAQAAALAMHSGRLALVARLMLGTVGRAHTVAEIRHELLFRAHRRCRQQRSDNGQQHRDAQHKCEATRMTSKSCRQVSHFNVEVRTNLCDGSSPRSAPRQRTLRDRSDHRNDRAGFDAAVSPPFPCADLIRTSSGIDGSHLAGNLRHPCRSEAPSRRTGQNASRISGVVEQWMPPPFNCIAA